MPTLTIPTIRVSLGWEYTNTTGISGITVANTNSISFSDTLAQGTGADQADLLFFNDYSITASATETIDLHTTSRTTVFGATTNYARIKLLYFEHQTPAATADCSIGGDALTGPATNKVLTAGLAKLRPGGVILIYTPDSAAYTAIADTTADEITILNNAAGTVTVRFVLIGTSA